MEALWSFEDKFKVSTQKAVALFVFTSFLPIVLCTTAAALMRRRRSRRKGAVYQEPYTEASTTTTWAEPPRPGRGSVKKALMSSVRWSGARKWEVQFSGNGKERPTPLLVRGSCGGDFGWQSHNSTSPVCGKGQYSWVKSVSFQDLVALYFMMKEGGHLISLKKEALIIWRKRLGDLL